MIDKDKSDLSSVFDTVIFDKKTVRELLSDIYNSVNEEDAAIKESIQTLTNTLSKDEENAEAMFGFIAPIIKDFFGESIKNKKLLVDLANTIQKLISTAKYKDQEDSEFLSDSERTQLLKNLNNTQKEASTIQHEVDKIGTSYNERKEDTAIPTS